MWASGLGYNCYLLYWAAVVLLGFGLGWHKQRSVFLLGIKYVIFKRQARQKEALC